MALALTFVNETKHPEHLYCGDLRDAHHTESDLAHVQRVVVSRMASSGIDLIGV